MIQFYYKSKIQVQEMVDEFDYIKIQIFGMIGNHKENSRQINWE